MTQLKVNNNSNVDTKENGSIVIHQTIELTNKQQREEYRFGDKQFHGIH